MSLIFSWMRLRATERLAVVLVGLFLATATLADTASVRMGRHFLDVVGRRFQDLHSIPEVLEMLSLGTQLFVKDVRDCEGLVAVPPSKEHGRDALRDTYAIIQATKVDCWSVLQIDPGARIAPTVLGDRIGPDVIHGIMGRAMKLSVRNEEWRKALTTFYGGVITCKDDERCLLARPDGKDPPDDSVAFELILAQGHERFIRVTQLYRGQSGFIYGIRWRVTPDGGEVVAIFPDLP